MEVITQLSDLRGNEVSLVRRGANRKVFAVSKAEGDQTVNIKAILDTPAEGEEQLVATMKSANADEKRIAAATIAYRIQKGLADVLKPEDLLAVAKSAGVELPVVKGGGQDEEPGAGTSHEDDMPGKPGKAKKTKKSADEVIASLSDEDRAQVEAVFKSNASLTKKTADLEKLVTDLVDARDLAMHVAKAEKFQHIPGYSTEQLGRILKSASGTPELAKSLEALLGQVNEVVAKSGLLTKLGAGPGGAAPNTAAAQLEALAEGFVQKSAGKMTVEKARSEVLKTAEGKRLYREYLGENPSQRAKANW